MKNKLVCLTLGIAMSMAPMIASANSTVSASSDHGSSISPSGIVVVPTGVTQTFTVGANSGFNILNVSLDGSNLGAVGSVNFTGLSGDLITHSINVTSEVMAGGAGQLYCSGPTAPGWQVGVPGGGCGGAMRNIPAGVGDCPFWFVGGCMEK